MRKCLLCSPQDLLAISKAQTWEIMERLGVQKNSFTCHAPVGRLEVVSVEEVLTNFSEDLTPTCHMMHK